MTSKTRVIPGSLLPVIQNTIPEQTQAAVQAIVQNPDRWHVFAGPYKGNVARIRASQANHGKRWRSITTEHPTMQFRSWTDPDDGLVYVLAMVPA